MRYTREYITNKLLLFSAFVAIFILFRTTIDTVVYKYIIHPFLEDIQESVGISIDITILTIIIGCRIYKIAIEQEGHVSVDIAVMILFLWVMYRFNFDTWTLYSAPPFDRIKLVDILYLPLSLEIFLLNIPWFRNVLTQRMKKSDVRQIPVTNEPVINMPFGQITLHIDEPIIDSKEDRLKLERYINPICDYIKKYGRSSKKSLTIGVNAPWGHGKSSFLNLLNEKLKEECIVLRFSSWDYDNCNLSKVFFADLGANLRKYGVDSTSFYKYVEAISGVGNPVVDYLVKLLRLYTAQTKTSRYNNINRKISSLKKHVVVYIDDVDRLLANEILDLLQLIRNTGSFSNITYVVAFDKSYTANCLNKHGVPNSSAFLEKFFQYELVLPPIQKALLKDRLWELIEGHVVNYPESDVDCLKEAIFGIESTKINSVVYVEPITNFREVINVANCFIVQLHTLRLDINLIDLLNLSILIVKYQSVYMLLKDSFNRVVSEMNDYRNPGKLGLYSVEEANEKAKQEKGGGFNLDILKSSQLALDKLDLKAFLTKNSNDFSLSNFDLELVINLLEVLFTDNANNTMYPLKRINNSYGINRYFYNELFEADLSDDKISRYNNAKYHENDDDLNSTLKEVIKELSEPATYRSFFAFLDGVKLNKKEISKKVLFTYFYLGYLREDRYVVSINDLMKKIVQAEFDQDEAELFIKELMSLYMPNDFVIHIGSQSSYENLNFIIPKEDLMVIGNSHFKKLLNIGDCPVQRIYLYWNYLHFTEFIPVEGKSNTFDRVTGENKEADKLFLEYIKNNKHKMLPTLYGRDMGNRKPIYNLEFVLKLWKSWEAFEEFINELRSTNDDEVIQEFVSFYDFYKKNERKPIEYDLKFFGR